MRECNEWSSLLGLLGLYVVRRTATLDSFTSRSAVSRAQPELIIKRVPDRIAEALRREDPSSFTLLRFAND